MFFFKSHAENDAWRLVPYLFLFFFKKKASGLQLSFNIFRQPSTWYTIKTSCIKLQTIDPEIYSILIFQKRVWDQFLHHILCMIFQEKCFSCYILLTDQISLSDCIYFLRYCVLSTCVFEFPGCDVINFENNLIFLIKPFFYIAKKPRQKF